MYEDAGRPLFLCQLVVEEVLGILHLEFSL